MKRFKGFTLVEIAIILVILGLLIGLGASLIGPLTKRMKYSESKEIVRTAVEAFKGYAIRYGYLPNSTMYNPNSSDPAFGIVGVKGLDALNKPLLYVVAPELTKNDTDICTLNATSLRIIDIDNQTKYNIAFYIVSGGLNYNIQTNATIYLQGTPNVDDFPSDSNRREEYDDIVYYVSLNELIALRCNYSRMICSNMTITIVNSSLKVNGTGTCINDTTTIFQTDFITVWRNPNCSGMFKGNYTFSQLEAFDRNKNCKVKVDNNGDIKDDD